MIAVLSFLLILVVSILVTKVASIALAHTGLSRESARFQARSAFSGVGFTTAEAEKVVGHPVRRRILMVLMLLGNAGIVTAISSLILSFVDARSGGGVSWAGRLFVILAGSGLLWLLASSQLVDRWLSRAIEWAVARWTDLDTRDYADLLHLAGEYQVKELRIRKGDWLAGKDLRELRLTDEGVLVLAILRSDGRYIGAPTPGTEVKANDVLILYGRRSTLEDLDERRSGAEGDREHREAVSEQQGVIEQQEEEERQAEEKRRLEEEEEKESWETVEADGESEGDDGEKKGD